MVSRSQEYPRLELESAYPQLLPPGDSGSGADRCQLVRLIITALGKQTGVLHMHGAVAKKLEAWSVACLLVQRLDHFKNRSNERTETPERPLLPKCK